VHGLHLEEERVDCNGLSFVRVDGQTWSLIEGLWMRDQELDAWSDLERIFAVMQYEGEVGPDNEAIFAKIFASYSAVVTAARLLAPGVWLDAWHVAPVARGDNGFNVRLVSSERPRLWASVFGEPLKVRGRRRELRDRVECRPLQYHLPHGPAYMMNFDRARKIELRIAELAELGELAPQHAWWIAHRAFQHGHDIFIPRRRRLTVLFTAFEAIFGQFRGEAKDPGIGAAVARMLEHCGQETRDSEAYVEKELRRVRNRLAHGSDLRTGTDFAAVEESLLSFLRLGLACSSAWIRGIQQPDGPIAPGAGRSMIAFQCWLGRVVSDDGFT
jgi:hypothetical protein